MHEQPDFVTPDPGLNAASAAINTWSAPPLQIGHGFGFRYAASPPAEYSQCHSDCKNDSHLVVLSVPASFISSLTVVVQQAFACVQSFRHLCRAIRFLLRYAFYCFCCHFVGVLSFHRCDCKSTPSTSASPSSLCPHCQWQLSVGRILRTDRQPENARRLLQ